MSTELSHQQLLDALGQVYARLTLVDLDTNVIHILHNPSTPEEVGCDFDYDEYLNNIAGKLSKTMEEYREQLRAARLKAIFMSGRDHWELVTADTALTYRFHRDEHSKHLMASGYLYLPKKQMGDIMHQIATNLIFKFCDYFLLVDPYTDSYYTFASTSAGTPLHPKFSASYSTEIARYTREHVAPQDRALVLREMSLPRVITNLNRKGVHYFYVGVMEPGRGYARKRVEFRYCDAARTMILLTRIDISDLWNEQAARERKLLNALELAYTDHITLLHNEQGFAVQCEERLKHIQDMVRQLPLGRTASLNVPRVLCPLDEPGDPLNTRAHSLLEPKESTKHEPAVHYATMILVKINGLSQLRHQYGKEAAHSYLKHVAQLLRQLTDPSYVLGHISEHSFAIFMTLDCSEQNTPDYIAPCLKLAQDVARMVPEIDLATICGTECELKLSCALGIVKIPQDGLEYPELLNLAKMRTVAALKQGPNNIVATGFYPEHSINLI